MQCANLDNTIAHGSLAICLKPERKMMNVGYTFVTMTTVVTTIVVIILSTSVASRINSLTRLSYYEGLEWLYIILILRYKYDVVCSQWPPQLP